MLSKCLQQQRHLSSLCFWVWRRLSSGAMASGGAADTMERTSDSEAEPVAVEESPSKAKNPRVFDFSKYNYRHIALKLAYLGANYQGFARQNPPSVTIESRLFDVFKRTKLIEDISKCNYSRCGRTDKGVSALDQVISLHVRSNLEEGPGVIVPEGSHAHLRGGDKTKELPYTVMLNRNLPDDIQVLSWADVPPDFSARFSCKSRTYKYFFPKSNMDLDAMREAAQHFIGMHDFRNFCKMDVSNGVIHFVRTINLFDISTLDSGVDTPYQMCEATVKGKAFLQHQVRCMMGLLFLVGNGLEQPSVISHMLDIEKCPCKPQYGMAAPEPLVLFNCEFEGVAWKQEKTAEKVIGHFQQLWTQQAVKSVMIQRMLDSLQSSLMPSEQAPPPPAHMAPLLFSDHRLGSRAYKPILKRPTANSFDEVYERHMSKKRRTDQNSSSDVEAYPQTSSEEFSTETQQSATAEPI